jgi:ATP-dependent DNA ligase
VTPTQLVQLVGEYRGELPPGQWVASVKVDGWRAAWFRGIDGKPRLWTRGGLPIEGVAHIAARCLAMEEAAGGPLFIDGEFQCGGTLLATKAWCERAWKLGGCNGTFFAFDCLSSGDWQRGGTDQPWLERQERLHALVDATETLSREPGWVSGATGEPVPERYVTALPGELIQSHAGVVRAAEEVWAAGGEGLVLKRIDSLYRRNRSSDWLKVKQEQKWRMAA